MRKLKLPLKRKAPREPARSPAHAEQRLITALFVVRVDELREPRGLSLERLAGISDVSVSSLQRMRSNLPDPRLTSVLRLCRGLDVTPGELLDGLPLTREARPRRHGSVVR
jgi:DNA-binding Xre family transcriptional regulator